MIVDDHIMLSSVSYAWQACTESVAHSLQTDSRQMSRPILLQVFTGQASTSNVLFDILPIPLYLTFQPCLRALASFLESDILALACFTMIVCPMHHAGGI